ncbi:Scavenger receptor cysteine-rich type 1 protein M130 [Liparis tanakae]|uniref:Scavenger receptor cysteine-rich type 1 protein M130 n=1 Tax=Liparis tanakae TaxID=230148 RepID=A0A4Z2EWM4_9TELE|nr:Scavenger receptor cysteine-rich type 1 protein M130 [Liparis tanakae]
MTGNITVDLTDGCWGNVNVCVGGRCGGVCADTWTPEKAAMLCENLGCGNRVLAATTKPKGSRVVIKSMHSTEETTHLSQCNFVMRDENDKTCDHNPAYVVCSGSVKAKWSSSRDKCSGNVEVQYEGRSFPVCTNALANKDTQNTICGELRCGYAVDEIGYFGDTAAGSRTISNIQCSARDESLAECIIDVKRSTCSPGALQCSGWSKMALTVNKACSGVPIVYSKGKISAISLEGWTNTEGERLCRDLDCGSLKSVNTTTTDCFWTANFSCAAGKIPDNIWDCENNVYVSEESQSKKQLFIECQDEPAVTLSEGCFGEVKIDGVEVCDSHWKESDAQMVCEEQNCSNAIADSRHVIEPSPNKDYHHVSCEDNHYTLGQCKRFMGKCFGRLVSVYCVRMLSRKDMAFESGDYDDLTSPTNELEQLNRFRSESEVPAEDDRSSSSLPYDDVEVPTVAPRTRGNRGNRGNRDAPGQSAGNRLFLTDEDEPESYEYDDVEAGADAPLTHAEVHERTQTPTGGEGNLDPRPVSQA